MHKPDDISKYINTVCDQIRWKTAHASISEEITNHIVDQKNAFLAIGLDEKTATDRAIREMGDPILVGTELDRTHRPKIEWTIVALTGVILLLGLVIKLFVSFDSDGPMQLSSIILSTAIGIGVMLAGYFLDFTIIGKYSKIIFFGLFAIILGIIIITPRLAGEYFYVKFLLLLFPTAFTGIIYSMRNKGYKGIVLITLFLVTFTFFIQITAFSSLFIFLATSLFLITYSILKGWFNVKKLSAILIIYLPVITGAIITLISNPYYLHRLKGALNASSDPYGAGYLSILTREIIGNAKFFGQSAYSTMLPNIQTDFLLTYLIYKYGWLAFIVVITVISALIVRSFMLSSRQKSMLGKLVATSVLITFTMQVILYVAFNLGFQPIAPLTLPLVSYGGTATIINMLLIGIMLSVFKTGNLISDKALHSRTSKNKFFDIVDGKIIIDLNTKS